MSDLSQAELKELAGYEIFLLTQVYEIIRQPLSKQYTEILEYPCDGIAPRRKITEKISMMTGDWRRGFLNVGGPVIFASSFKIFDLIVEWILGDEARTPKGGSLQFKEKVMKIKAPARVWPYFLRDQSWIRDRLIVSVRSGTS